MQKIISNTHNNRKLYLLLRNFILSTMKWAKDLKIEINRKIILTKLNDLRNLLSLFDLSLLYAKKLKTYKLKANQKRRGLDIDVVRQLKIRKTIRI